MKSEEINRFIQDHLDWTDEKLAKKLGITKQAVKNRRTRISGTNEQTLEEKVEQEKVKLLATQIKRAESAEVKDRAKYELFVGSLKEAISPLQFTMPKRIEPVNGNPADEEDAVLVLSDLHFGKRSPSYSLEIAQERLVKVIDATIKIVKLHRKAYPIRHLHILWTGDIVDGSSIFPTQSHHSDGHVINQIFGIMPEVVAQLARLATFFEQVSNHCIRGNHGRVGKDAHEETNFDNIFYKTMELATVNIPNMTWSIPLGWSQIIQVRNTRILQYHGHQIKSVMNLPWYGITTRVSRWAATEGMSNFDVAVQGHFHSSSAIRWNQKKIFTNGTMVSGDEFALEFIGLESSESQWLFGVHDLYKTTWAYEIKY